MDHRLTDVQNPDPGPRQDTGNGRGQTGPVGAGDIDQDDFLQGVAPVRKKETGILPTMPDASQRQPFSAMGEWLYWWQFACLPHYRSSPLLNSKQNATDNLFLRGHASLRKTRLTLPSILLMLAVVPLALTFLAVLWFGQLQLQRDIARQADSVGSELARQIASVVADPLAAEDTLSLNIILAHWAQNPMIAHASLTGANNRVVAEAGRRPAADSLAPGQGRFIAAVHVQDELIGQLHLSLARAPFASPAASLVEALLWCIVLLGVISGLIAWRYAVGVRRTLAGLGNWYGDTGQPAPGTGRIDEVGDLARRLAERRITDLPPEPEPEPEPEFDIEPEELDEHIAL